MIISRYLTKEVLSTLLAVTFVLLLIFLSDQLVRYLSYAASGKIASNVLFQLLAFEIPYLLSVLLPLGLYLGVILAYGRLYADSELRVLHACGFTIRQLFDLTCLFAFFVTLIVVVLMLWVNPKLAEQKDKILSNKNSANLLGTLIPGRFQVMNDGKRVIYIEKISRDHKKANNLFIADQKKETDENSNSPWVVLSAANGFQAKDKKTQDQFVVATDGARYDGEPGQNAYKIIAFKKYAVRVPNDTVNSKRQEQETVPTINLFKNYNNPDAAAELQWRLSIPLSAFILALLAIPLSQIKPRQGRYSMLLPAIFIYVVYVNLLFAARNLVEQKIVPLGLGMWWVHLIGLAVLGFFALSWRTKKV